MPNWYYKVSTAGGLGLQSEEEELRAPEFERVLYLLCRAMITVERAPAVWHQASCCRLAKHNNKAGTDAERPIMFFCGLGRSFYRSMMKNKLHFPYWAHGGISYRRREDAMLVQQCGAARLRGAGVSHITRFHDASNAFYCVKKEAVEQTIPELVQEGKEEYFMQRILNSTFIISDNHESAHMANGSGVLPGDHAATKLFVKTYSQGIEWMNSILNMDPWQRALHMKLPAAIQAANDHTKVDLATSTFVDDVARKIMGADQHHIQKVAYWENRVFDQALEEVGGKQNIDKQQNLVQGAGKQAVKFNRDFHKGSLGLEGKTVSAAKYLGGLQHFNNGFSAEKNIRLQATRTAWHKMGNFWTTARVSLRFKSIVFVGVVVNAALSGLEAYVSSMTKPITRRSLEPLQQLVFKFARVVLQGRHTIRRGQMVRAPSNLEVMRHMRLGSLFVELRIRRLKWLQDIAARPLEHRQVLAALVGQAQCEP
eukprot:9494029-Pyramimonas_sp.AAC.1